MNISWGKTHSTQQDDSHNTGHNYSVFSAANINNKPGPGYPDPYNNGSSSVAAVKYVTAGGEKITITELPQPLCHTLYPRVPKTPLTVTR